MIRLTRLNGKQITVNALLVESIEETPDTMITLITGKKITVLEPGPEVVQQITQYMRSIGSITGTIKSLDSEGL
ncbi:Flagellar protein (FlbD) [Paenibacillus konkukensis]|uniref:Flagellar protein (FlbD) n=1 Tax=Paenibacillus konkukensis TaxID=2020716 RepID=A0ABY4RYE0_9BACL|nr:flagellar FlbD family protein [Paenibacillus konkukensis]UQZ87342.1 Flagellar protein (FlbD) [Paenibacillus konkukensis]